MPIPAPLRRTAQWMLSLTAVLGVLCGLVFAACLVLDVRPVIVRSGSMSPAVSTGSLVFARQVDARDLRVGDIVTVADRQIHVTHRIVGIEHAGEHATLRLKGDANTRPDDRTYDVTSAYRYWFDIPVLGSVIAWFSQIPGVFVLAGFVAVMLIVALRPTPRGPGAASAGRRKGVPRRSRKARRAARATALTAVVVAGSAVPAFAVWTDTATVAGTSLSTPTVLRSDTMTCTNGAAVLLGYYDSVTLTVTHKDTLYNYVARIYNGSGVKQGADRPMASGSTAVGGTVSIKITATEVAGLLQLGAPVYVRIYSNLKASATWESATYREWRLDTGLLGVLLLNGIKCGANTSP